MGIAPNKVRENLYSYADLPWFSTTRDTPEKVMHDFAGYAKYHEKWDWIIPVVKKIVECDSNIHKHTSPFTEDDGLASHTYLYAIMDALTDLSIQGLFDAVYEYVQWYQSLI